MAFDGLKSNVLIFLAIGGLAVFSPVVPAQDAAFEKDFDTSNCKARSDNWQLTGNFFELNTVPPTDKAEVPFDRDYPLNQCLDQIRLHILSKLGNTDGTLRTSDKGWVEFGEKGALTRCAFRVDGSSRVPESLMNKILKYEGAIPKDRADDPLENFPPEKIRGWSKATEDIVVIDCLVS